MYLLLALLCLTGAVGLFSYEFATGTIPLRLLGRDISSAWLLLVLALYNLARWYSRRALRHGAQADDYVARARLRQAQRRERAEPDPNFDFTDPPPPR